MSAHLHNDLFKFVPQLVHNPLQSSLHNCFIGLSNKTKSCIIGSRSIKSSESLNGIVSILLIRSTILSFHFHMILSSGHMILILCLLGLRIYDIH